MAGAKKVTLAQGEAGRIGIWSARDLAQAHARARRPRVKTLDQVIVHANQGLRQARVLAILENTALVEYSLPNGTTGLAFCNALAWGTRSDGSIVLGRVDERPCTYRSLLKPWLVAVIEQAGSWKGNSFSGRMPTPEQVLRKRLKENTTKRGRKMPELDLASRAKESA